MLNCIEGTYCGPIYCEDHDAASHSAVEGDCLAKRLRPSLGGRTQLRHALRMKSFVACPGSLLTDIISSQTCTLALHNLATALSCRALDELFLPSTTDEQS